MADLPQNSQNIAERLGEVLKDSREATDNSVKQLAEMTEAVTTQLAVAADIAADGDAIHSLVAQLIDTTNDLIKPSISDRTLDVELGQGKSTTEQPDAADPASDY